jgi:glyoxylase-like metal-dependent hydrolase (beta-lactamase superfamily II)
VDLVHEKFSSEPIRFAFVGHYHPHYTGGLRAMVAANATIVAPPGIARYAGTIAHRPFTRVPDRLARTGRGAKILEFKSTFAIDDELNRLEAIDIGARSLHTDEYVVFYFPRAKLVIEGDLGWFAGKDGKLRAGGRANGLLAAIDERGLAVTTLAQAWPMRNSPTVLPLGELRALANP